MHLSGADFPEFFAAIYDGREPFPWQSRLAKRVSEIGWPKAIALPTAAGKTGCIDIAVFSLACQVQRCPRRIFFVVDRRIVVDQAFLHARHLVDSLRNAESGIIKRVADALRELGGDQESPLEAYAVRGGIYRETAWARSPIQPMVVTSTVDQVGSRLLFRGYGVTDSMKPVHAGLVGNDSLILLDEAHCSNPFCQTIQAVERYRSWADASLEPTPFSFVSITATPTAGIPEEEVERDQNDDRNHAVLGARLRAKKPATLVIAEKAQKSKWRAELVKELAKQARQLMGQSLGLGSSGTEHSVKAVGIVVNRVATARALAIELARPTKKESAEDLPQVVLLTGRMRPIDRDDTLKRIEGLFSDSGQSISPIYVVATQCIEVGADLDFHALVTECASLDALRQRFGRLNRVAARPGAKSVIVIRNDQVADTEDDPIYGKSLSKTWQWMRDKSTADTIDFGIASMRELLKGADLATLNVAALDAPTLFPSHLDSWVQTHPIPVPDPDTAVFLHGPQSALADVHVVFRNDLGDDPLRWAEIVALCPPSSTESLPVRISVFRDWLLGNDKIVDVSGDVEGESSEEPENSDSDAYQLASGRHALQWKGPNTNAKSDSSIVTDMRDIHPGDTFIVRCDAPNIEALGDFLPGGPADCAEIAYLLSRAKPLLRLQDVEFSLDDADFDDKLSEAVTARVEAVFSDRPTDVQNAIAKALTRTKPFARYRVAEPHPLGGYVVVSKQRIPHETFLKLLPQFAEQAGETFLDDSEASESPKSGRPVSLNEHSLGVAHHSSRFAVACGLNKDIYTRCGLFHDIGKLDPRNQAMLKSLAPRFATTEPLAKSGVFGSGNRDLHHYPLGSRHELLSTAMVDAKWNDDLLLYLIATHHGAARPFAAHVEENEAAISPFIAEIFGETFELPSCRQFPAEWNSRLAERFWRVVRHYGWWGAAYRETVFRLADHTQSRLEQSEPIEYKTPSISQPNIQIESCQTEAIPLLGLNGANPLGFLAALGVLRVLSTIPPDSLPSWLSSNARLSWGTQKFPGIAVLHTSSSVSADELTAFLMARLVTSLEQHPSRVALSLMAAGTGFDRSQFTELTSRELRDQAEWVMALFAELAPKASSQLMVVRRDYVEGNFASVMQRTQPEHLSRTLFATWDYADALDNQSLHWEPSEDRRHAYQWHQASGDPTRKKHGGMLGANRLALEAWPLFASFPTVDRLATRGFSRTRSSGTRWTWPLWSQPMNVDAITSLLSLPILQEETVDSQTLASYGISQVYRCNRILVGKTPNLTPAYAV